MGTLAHLSKFVMSWIALPMLRLGLLCSAGKAMMSSWPADIMNLASCGAQFFLYQDPAL